MAEHQNPLKWEEALETAAEIENLLLEACEKIMVAGSLRRKKEFVNDIEILCIPKLKDEIPTNEMFPKEENLLENKIEELIEKGVLERRLKKNGTPTYGKIVKLLCHTKTKMPVDIFTTSKEAWVNCLVSRTGGKETNIAIASRAKWKGLRWMLSGSGFKNFRTGEIITVHSEEEVFSIVGIPYLHPSQRP